MTAIELFEGLRTRLQKFGKPYGDAEIYVRGLDEKGDRVEFPLRGQFEVDRDQSGRSIIVLK
jgi:hypothetical protein